MRKTLIAIVVIIAAFVLAKIGASFSNPGGDTMARVQYTFGVAAGVALLISLWLAQYGWGRKISQGGIKTVQAAIIAGWLLIPPLYFWMEYFWLFKPALAAGAHLDLDEFEYGQDVSSKIWIATTSALALLYFWQDIKTKE